MVPARRAPAEVSCGTLGRRSILIGAVAAVVACNTVAGLGDLTFPPSTEAAGGGGGAIGAGGGAGEGGSVEPPKQSIGTPCTDNDVCASGSCTDGVCCDQACVGECLTCNQFDLSGTCTVLTGQPGDCPPGQVCTALGACTVADGGSCMDATTCAGRFCTDGVCCDEPCDGPCESCVAADTGLVDGICGAAPTTLSECGGESCVAKGLCCGEAVPADGGTCPAECSGGCSGTICTILCDEESECQGANLPCPAGFDCAVDCVGRHGCRDALIDCPPQHSCSVTCGPNTGTAFNHACEGATVTCTNGPCDVFCAADGDLDCRDLTIACGTNACDVSCPDSNHPLVNCGSACRCNTCP